MRAVRFSYLINSHSLSFIKPICHSFTHLFVDLNITIKQSISKLWDAGYHSDYCESPAELTEGHSMESYFNYFAYGSNMLTARLTADNRCPSAKAVGTAFVDGYAMDFSKFSKKDKSGKATIVKMPGHRLYGVVFTIKEFDRKNLNEAEGLGYGYDPIPDLNVTMADSGFSIATMTYAVTEGFKNTHLRPFDWYLALVIAGAMEHKLPKSVITVYRNTECNDDEDQERKCKELEILKNAILGCNWQV